MTTPTSARPARPFEPRPETRAVAAAVAALLLAEAAGAAWDPSGLLAPIGGRGLPVLGVGGVYRWAPLAVGLPVLLAATAAPLVALTRAATARWVFVVTWVTVVGAAALATAATGFVASLPLVGAHLPAGLALRFALATGGFAALKFLLIGPLVAGAAALAFRFGPRPATPPAAVPAAAVPAAAVPAAAVPAAGPESLPESLPGAGATIAATTIMFAVVVVAAVSFAAAWWRGGPAGYAFTGLLVAPSAAAGVAGFLVGTGAFLAAFFGAARMAVRRLSVDSRPLVAAAVVWFGAVAAGLGLGVLDAVLAALLPSARLADAGPDSWWIATTLLTMGTAIGYGATVGAIGAVLAAIGWQWRARLAHLVPVWPPAMSRRRSVAVGLVAVALLALPLVLGGPPPGGPAAVAPVAAGGGLPRLQLQPATDPSRPATIGDATGRQVLLRGVDVNQLIDYYLRDPAVPANQPLTDADFAQIAGLGFNVVRLGLSWSRLEPNRGTFDRAYRQQIVTAVALAKAHGIYTVLDLHEDAWGNALARPDQGCGGGTSATTGWDGAPAWATITDGTLHCQFMARDLAPAVATAFSNFYTDRDGIQTELVRTWTFVAQAFADEPAVAGYDLLNEPGIGADPPISSGLLLGRYYDAAIIAIRAAERAGHGFAHLAFFEPSVLWSGLGFDVAPPPGFTSDRQLVFAPHPYSESITMDQSLGLTIASIERNLTVSARAAASYGAALWVGEWGWFGPPTVDGAKVWRFAAAQDRLGIGGAFWVWRQGCGSPETGADAATSGNLVSVDCATGASTAPPAGFAQPLRRAYPRAFPGRLDSLVSEADGRGLRFAATVDTTTVNCQVDLWVPGEAKPAVATQGLTDVTIAEVTGGWTVTGCAHGTYSVTVTPS